MMFDETTDISHKSRLTFIFRYIHNGNVREDFFQFLDTRKEILCNNGEDDITEIIEPTVTGVDIGLVVLNTLKNNSFDLNSCVGIATDGCIATTSEQRGAVAEVQKES